jgi:hypothetical protein
MPPFAPKLTSDIGYTQAPTAPAAEPSVFSGIGDALSGALKTADKAFDSFKPKAPTYQQLKDEDELNSLNAFQTGTEKAAQLRAQGFDGQATAMENQIALDYVRAGGDPTSKEAEYMVERVTGRSHKRFGLSEETHAMMKLQESPEYEAAFLATWNTLPKDATGEDRVQAASVQAMQIFSAKSVVAVATGKSEAQAAMNKLNWDAPGGGRASYELLIENFVNPQLGAAMIADQAGKLIDPISLANSSLKFDQFKTNMLASRPRGLDEAQWSNVSERLNGISKLYTSLINKKENITAATTSALFAAMRMKGDLSLTDQWIIQNSSVEDMRNMSDPSSWSKRFKAISSLEVPLWKIGQAAPIDLFTGAKGAGNTGKSAAPKGAFTPEAINTYTGDPTALLTDVAEISKQMKSMDPKARGDATEVLANISMKMAASVFNSAVPFGAADIGEAYSGVLSSTIRDISKRDPQTAWAMALQHSEALGQMSTKSYQNANKKFGDFAKLGKDGKVRLNWGIDQLDSSTEAESSFKNFPAGATRAFIQDSMAEALKPYDGDIYAFSKAYRSSSKYNYGSSQKFNRGVQEFMESTEMRAFMEEGSELKEQMDSLVAINAARGRMQAEADLIENAYRLDDEAGDEAIQEFAPVPRERGTPPSDKSLAARAAEGVTGAIIDGIFKPAFSQDDGVALVQNAGAAASAISDTIIDGIFKPTKGPHLPFSLSSAAVAGTLPPAKQIENMGQSSYESKLKEYVGSHESNPQRAKAAGYASEYDVPIGYGKFDDPNNPPKPLTAMTFTEVYAYQKTLIKNSKGKLKNVDPSLGSSAVGRWQIIGPTLKRLTKKLGLQDSDKFTKNVQDQMFKILLDEAGQAKFKAGVITADQFQDNLSKIWASVPNSKGVSTYGQPVQSDRVPVPTAPVPKARPSGTEELPESQILDTVTQTVPDATPKEVKEVIDHLQGANTLDTIRALGPRQRAIMSAILNAYSEEEQQQPEQPAASSTVGSGPYRQPTPTPFVLGE